MRLSRGWSRARVSFDDPNLASCAGLAPVMALAEQAGLSELIADKVALGVTKVASAGCNPAGKLTSVIAGMCAGADSIVDLEVIRSGGTDQLFGGVYASATVGQLLRECTHGHVSQFASVLRQHLVALTKLTKALPASGSSATSTSTRCFARCMARRRPQKPAAARRLTQQRKTGSPHASQRASTGSPGATPKIAG